MDGSEETTGTYPLLSGAAGYAFQTETADATPRPSAADDGEPPTEEFDLLPFPQDEPAPPAALTQRFRPKAAVLVAVAVLLGGGALAYGLAADRSGSAEVAAPPRFVGPAPSGDAGAGAAPAFPAGTFDLTGSVGDLNLSLGRVADGPVRVTTPDGAANASITGTAVRVTAADDPARLDVTLDERIAWTIRMNGGVRTATFLLAGGTVRKVDLSGGADRVSLTLPDVDRALPIRMSGGVREWNILTTDEVPVRVRVQSGAGEVTLYGKRQRSIGRDTTLTAGDGSGLDVTAAAGFGTLAVSTPGR